MAADLAGHIRIAENAIGILALRLGSDSALGDRMLPEVTTRQLAQMLVQSATAIYVEADHRQREVTP